MALQSSGAISLDDMHQEVGGSANSNCSINDADIRGLISASAGAEMGFDDFYGASSSAVYGRAVTFGGYNNIGTYGSGASNAWAAGDHIDYVDIASTGNASDFGELYNDGRKRNMGCAGSNGSRALNYGGLARNRYNSAETFSNEIEYITLTSTGNGSDFGDLGVWTWYQSGCSSQTRGIAIHGYYGSSNTQQAGINDTIEYVTISSTGNATDYGDTATTLNDSGVTCSATRGVYAGGVQGGQNAKAMRYFTIASTGNTTSFGDIDGTYNRKNIFRGVASSQTRGLFIGGNRFESDGTLPTDGSVPSSGIYSTTKNVDYITIASTGNGTDFGDLDFFTYFGGQASSRTRALAMGGYGNSDGEGPSINIIQYFTIANVGNSTDFGDLQAPKGEMPANSGAHGGVV